MVWFMCFHNKNIVELGHLGLSHLSYKKSELLHGVGLHTGFQAVHTNRAIIGNKSIILGAPL